MGKNCEVESIVYEVPGTDKEVTLPIRIGDIRATEGCFLAQVVFDDWYEAKHSGYEVSRIFPQLIGNTFYPCFLADLPLVEYPEHHAYLNLIRAEQNKKARKKKLMQDLGLEEVSLEERLENGEDSGTGYDTTEAMALGNVFEEEVGEALDRRKPGLRLYKDLQEAGFNPREIAEICGKNKWTVTDDVKRVRETVINYIKDSE